MPTPAMRWPATAAEDRAHSGSSGCAYPSGGGLSRNRRECGSQQSRPSRALAERCCQQPADFAERQRPDRADPMAELEERRAVSDRRPNAAEKDRFARCSDADAYLASIGKFSTGARSGAARVGASPNQTSLAYGNPGAGGDVDAASVELRDHRRAEWRRRS